jgi:hypothetical protein
MSERAVNRSQDTRSPMLHRHQLTVTAIPLAAAVAFGALDQYIGSLYSQLGTAINGMSAPWLLLPFAIGAFQPHWRRAAWLGLAATWLAVSAYVLMIDSPMEGVHTTLHIVAMSAHSQWPWFLGGIVTGPLYAVLGYQWRAHRSILSAALATVPLLLEPVIGRSGPRPLVYPPAGYLEAVAGLALAGSFAMAIYSARLRRQCAMRR